MSRWSASVLGAILLATPVAAQDMSPAAGPAGPPAGTYEFVASESDRIDEKVDRAVAHMNFLIRGIARGRLKGANEPIRRIEIRYPGDTVWVSVRANEPPLISPRDGSAVDYRRADGEVVKLRSELSPGSIDQHFDSDDGAKRMVYRLRPDGLLALDVEVFSEKLREPFRYTWVFRPLER